MFVRGLMIAALSFLYSGAARAQEAAGSIDQTIEAIFEPIAKVANAVVFAAINFVQ